METESNFSSILKEILKRKNITQTELARSIGVKPNTISNYCKKVSQPDADIIVKIASYLDVSIDYLLTGQHFENKITREDLGLSERALEVLKAIAQGETFEGLSGYLDSLICDKDFREALYAAIRELQDASIRYPSIKAMYDTEDRTLDFDDYMNLLETRATIKMRAPIQQFFKAVNYGRKAYGKTPNDCFGKNSKRHR